MADVRHNTAQHRFEYGEGETLSVLNYRVSEVTMAITHTHVPPVLRGQGVASQLTKAALEWAKGNGLKVDPICSYAAVYIERHAEYQPLLAR